MSNASSSTDNVFIYKQWDRQLFRCELENGSITLMPKPPGADQLPAFVEYLQHKKIDVLVSLLQFDEVNRHGLIHSDSECQAHNINYINYQIKDHSVPQFFLPFNQLIESLHQDLQAGKNIAIHCYAGIGRTGLTAASVLIKQGMKVDEALIKLSQTRGLRVPETLEQITWLHHNAQQLLQNTTKI
jgi:protein-tyrosine phosphatase